MAVFPTGFEAAQNSAPQRPPVADAFEQAMAATEVGGALSVIVTVSRSPLRCALVPRMSIAGHDEAGAPVASKTSPAGSVTAWSVIGYELIAAMFWPLKMLAPESCREKNCRVSCRESLSSAQVVYAARVWSTSMVRKSSRSRFCSAELWQAMPAVQIPPVWIGWSEICTSLKFAPGLSAFCDCPKYVFQTVLFGWQPVWLDGSHELPFAS